MIQFKQGIRVADSREIDGELLIYCGDDERALCSVSVIRKTDAGEYEFEPLWRQAILLALVHLAVVCLRLAGAVIVN